MRRLFNEIKRLAGDDAFLAFQNDLAVKMYRALNQGYSNGDDEIKLVQRLVSAVDGVRRGSVSLAANMLHGKESMVEFKHGAKKTRRELGDMAVISLISAGGKRLLEKIVIIQNKKSNGKSWSIDLGQLFLLKNFPTFSGTSGLLGGYKNVAFRNASGCLGAFGLLSPPGDSGPLPRPPGDMLFAAAHLVSEFLRGKKSVHSKDIMFHSCQNTWQSSPAASAWYDVPSWEWYMCSADGMGDNAFLGNVWFCRDLYDFTRAWTRLSLGEMTCIGNRIVNKRADAFANHLLSASGLNNNLPIPTQNDFSNEEAELNMGVFLMHMDLDKKKKEKQVSAS